VRLDRVLKAARESATLSAEQRAEWEPTLQKLAREWESFLEQAGSSLTQEGILRTRGSVGRPFCERCKPSGPSKCRLRCERRSKGERGRKRPPGARPGTGEVG